MTNGGAQGGITIVEAPADRGGRIRGLAGQRDGLTDLDNSGEGSNDRLRRVHPFDHGDRRVRTVRPGLVRSGQRDRVLPRITVAMAHYSACSGGPVSETPEQRRGVACALVGEFDQFTNLDRRAPERKVCRGYPQEIWRDNRDLERLAGLVALGVRYEQRHRVDALGIPDLRDLWPRRTSSIAKVPIPGHRSPGG